MASTSCTYDFYFKRLIEKHELCPGKDIHGKWYFMLVVPAYNVRRYRNFNY